MGPYYRSDKRLSGGLAPAVNKSLAASQESGTDCSRRSARPLPISSCQSEEDAAP